MKDPLPTSEGLPEGFGWATMYDSRPTLFYHSQPIADIQSSGEAWVARTSLQRMHHELRTVQLSSLQLAIRYCVAYVRRWEDRIRTDLGYLKAKDVGPVVSLPQGIRDEPQTPVWTSSQENARRRGRPSKSGPRLG